MKILNLCLCLALGGIVIGVFLLTKSHTDYSSVDPVASFDAEEFNQFVSALSEAERGELGDGVYAVEGEVEALSRFGFILKGGVVCTTKDSSNLGLYAGDEVKIKGRFISFDELFEEVRLDHVVAL